MSSVNERAKLNMLIGAGIFGLGVAVTGISHAASQHGGRYLVVAYGALIVGGLQFLVGMLQSSGPQPKTVDLIVGSLAFFVRNPEAPSANEIKAINLFVQISAEEIRDAAIAMRRQDGGLNGFLARNNDRITRDVAKKIIQGVYAVVIADGLREGTPEALNFLGRLLYLSEAEVAELVGGLAQQA